MGKIFWRDTGVMADGSPVTAYELRDERGGSVTVLSYGCTVTGISVPDKNGVFTDVVLGFDSVGEYQTAPGFFGATVGRVANRIAGGRFKLAGTEYRIETNNGVNTLHGGPGGFHQKNWECAVDGDALVASVFSPAGEGGFPGNLRVEQRITFADGALRLCYTASSDADTPVCLTNHAYFNLNGHDSGDVLGHEAQIFADGYSAVDETLIPLGFPAPVYGTPFDFREPKPIGRDISGNHPQLLLASGGYDHNFALRHGEDPAGIFTGEKTGIRMRLYTDYPGVQFYTANGVGAGGPMRGKAGAAYRRYAGFCAEAQQFPNAVNMPEYPSAVQKAGEEISRFIEFRFDCI